MPIQMPKRHLESGVIKDLVISDKFPNSTPILFRETLPDGTIEYTLVIRTKITNMTTHTSTVMIDPIQLAVETNDSLRSRLLANMREL